MKQPTKKRIKNPEEQIIELMALAIDQQRELNSLIAELIEVQNNHLLEFSKANRLPSQINKTY